MASVEGFAKQTNSLPLAIALLVQRALNPAIR